MTAASQIAIAVPLLMALVTPAVETQGSSCQAQTLRSLAARGDLTAFNTCLKGGPAVDGANSDGLTALMVAAATGHRDIVLALIAAGANVNYATPRDGLTALFMAAHWGHQSSAEALVEKGANVLQRDKGDRNAVDWASGYADGRKEEAIATAKYLMSKGTPLVQRGGMGLFLEVGSKPDIETMVAREAGSRSSRGVSTPSDKRGASVPQAEPTHAILFLEKRDGTAVELRIIAVATQAEAEQVLARLAKGEPFAKVAAQTSLHSTKVNGGYLGRLEMADLRDDFRAALADIPISGYSKIMPFK